MEESSLGSQRNPPAGHSSCVGVEGHVPRLEPLLDEAAWLRRLARGLVQQEADADDLVQDTWVALLRGREQPDAPRGWIRRIAGRTASHQRRSTRRRVNHESLSVGPAVEQRSTDEIASRLELAAIVADALRGLPEPYRGTLYEHYYEGTSAPALAARHGIPQGTVRWRLSKGRSLLRERLCEHDGRNWNEWVLSLSPIVGATGSAAPTAGALSSGAASTLGIAMSIKTTFLGACAGALVAGGAWISDSPPMGAPDYSEPAAPSEARASSSSAVASPEVAPTSAPKERTAGPAGGADSLFGTIGFGRITDPSGAPIAGAVVELVSDTRLRHRVTSGPKGAWSCIGLEPTEYEVTLSKAGSITTRQTVRVPDLASWRHDVVLDDALTLPVRFETEDGVAADSADWSAPERFLAVAATSTTPPERMRVGGRILSQSESGQFLARSEEQTPPDLSARYQGLLALTAEPPLHVSLVYRDVVLESRVLAGTESEIVFVVPDLSRSNGSVRARIVDRESGAPLTERITLQHPSGGIGVEPTIEAGTLVFEDVPPGTMDLLGRLQDYERLEFGVRIDPGEEVDVGTIALGQAAPFQVVTLDEEGQPRPIRVVAVRPDTVSGPLDMRHRIGANENANGVTNITWLAAGPTLIRAGGRDGLARVALEVDTRETHSVELVVPEGVLVHFEGLALTQDEFYVLEDPGGAMLYSGERAPVALYLAPGSYVLRVLSGATERARHAITVRAESEVIDLGRH